MDQAFDRGRGHRRIAMIRASSVGQRPRAGYEKVMRAAGLATEFVTDTTYWRKRARPCSCCSERPRATDAVFGANGHAGDRRDARSPGRAGLIFRRISRSLGFDEPTAALGLTRFVRPEFEDRVPGRSKRLIERLQPGGEAAEQESRIEVRDR